MIIRKTLSEYGVTFKQLSQNVDGLVVSNKYYSLGAIYKISSSSNGKSKYLALGGCTNDASQPDKLFISNDKGKTWTACYTCSGSQSRNYYKYPRFVPVSAITSDCYIELDNSIKRVNFSYNYGSDTYAVTDVTTVAFGGNSTASRMIVPLWNGTFIIGDSYGGQGGQQGPRYFGSVSYPETISSDIAYIQDYVKTNDSTVWLATATGTFKATKNPNNEYVAQFINMAPPTNRVIGAGRYIFCISSKNVYRINKNDSSPNYTVISGYDSVQHTVFGNIPVDYSTEQLVDIAYYNDRVFLTTFGSNAGSTDRYNASLYVSDDLGNTWHKQLSYFVDARAEGCSNIKIDTNTGYIYILSAGMQYASWKPIVSKNNGNTWEETVCLDSGVSTLPYGYFANMYMERGYIFCYGQGGIQGADTGIAYSLDTEIEVKESKYLDQNGAQEIVTQFKAYCDSLVGGE